jgi:hypothetical protein
MYVNCGGAVRRMRRSSEVKGVYVGCGLTLTFVLGRTNGLAAGLGAIGGIDIGKGDPAPTADDLFIADFAITLAAIFLAAGRTAFLAASFLLSGFTTCVRFFSTGFATFFALTVMTFFLVTGFFTTIFNFFFVAIV